MTIGELRSLLAQAPDAGLHLMLPGGEFVPAHFHVTEVGRVQKDFIDCGGTMRSTASGLLQVWIAQDVDHRLTTTKLAAILKLAAPMLKSDELPVEIEYEREAVSQFPVAAGELTPAGVLLILGTKHTECLAPDRCGVPVVGSACAPGAGCC